MAQTQDTIVLVYFSGNGKCDFQDSAKLEKELGVPQVKLLKNLFNYTYKAIRKNNRDLYYTLAGNKIRLRLAIDCEKSIYLAPHELVLDNNLLETADETSDTYLDYLTGILESGLFHFCNPEFHVTQVQHHSIYFYHAHPSIYQATVQELNRKKNNSDQASWLEALTHKDRIIQLEAFWAWIAARPDIKTLYETGIHSNNKNYARLKHHISDLFHLYFTSQGITEDVSPEDMKQPHVYRDNESVIFVYPLGKNNIKVVRIRHASQLDAFSSEAASHTLQHDDICTDIFYDHDTYIKPWIKRIKIYSKDLTLKKIMQSLLAEDVHTVQTAINELFRKFRHDNNAYETTRLLYACLYHNFLPDKALSTSVRYRVSRILEDLLSERPRTFPRSQVNRTVFRGEKASIQIKIDKPYRVKIDKIRLRVQWVVNGNRKRTLPLKLNKKDSSDDILIYEIEFPVHKGWIHYAVQVSYEEGKWLYERFDPNSQGLLKYVADERGQRVLSLYADTFNLELDENLNPIRDEYGAYKYGSFDQLAEQLEDIRAEGYTRIYPLGALELGWAGEAGPDPSVFSIWDGKTVRRDLGGLPGLLRLKKRADELHMKIILCVVSHFSKANTNYPYRLPVYIRNTEGKMVRRAGWDGEWDEWHDSFMVNMRDFENVQYLTRICEELAGYGFGLRIDVGHGFDTVFPVDSGQNPYTQFFGDITLPGFEQLDLRRTTEANVPIMYLSYRVQKANPATTLCYSEQWHGNEVRMIKSATVPYNAIIKNLENIRAGQNVNQPMGLNDDLRYLSDNYIEVGGQTLSLFNSHDEESPASNYQNMIWPAAAFLVFSSYGPIMYHMSRLPQDETGTFRKRFDLAYLECWKHWVNNRFAHPWRQEVQMRDLLIQQYPLLKGFGLYLRSLFQIADELPALTKGTITPLETHNGRIAAFIRSYGEHTILCVFNFPNPYHEGQQAVSREFNFTFHAAGSNQPVVEISEDNTYELKERYNNTEGRQRRGKKQYWSGEELLTLGFGGTLPPVSSNVYEIIYRDHSIHERMVLPDSFSRYFRYGKEERIRHSFIAKTFRESCLQETNGFERFCELFIIVMHWVLKHRRFGIPDFSVILGEICEDQSNIHQQMVHYLMRIAVNENGLFEEDICKGAGEVLQSINVGPVVLVSPESQYSGTSGGVGLYTTDIADVLSEMGFHIIIVTPLYECNRQYIFDQFNPRYDGHSFTVRFPHFREDIQQTEMDAQCEVVHLYRSRMVRYKHGKQAKIDVFYMQNATYFDKPYGGSTSEDKLRRARMLSQSALEAIRTFNVYPSVIQTNEWPTWLLPAYLQRWEVYRNDSHFQHTHVLSMMHNPHPSYSISLDEKNDARRDYYAKVLGLDPLFDADLLCCPDSASGREINMTYMMLKASPFIGTVSQAMRERILHELNLFGNSQLYMEKYQDGRFFARRNGFNMGARQRFWFGSKKSLLETYGHTSQRRLFAKYIKSKKNAKLNLQNDPNIRIAVDDEEQDHIIFGMLHRICRQKGFELLLDWKVYDVNGNRQVYYEPWKTDGATVMEYFLSSHPLVQFVICGRVEDSPDGLRFHRHLQRIKENPYFSAKLGYYPEGNLSSSLYRNLYIGCQFFVMPSGGDVGEPCGISQQEAHAGGTPVVAHHQDGLIRTVADRDFGDKHIPPNGIKFSGFNGEALLEALLDAVEIYTKGQRRLYQDKNDKPKSIRYTDLCFNAFRTDHRWLRLLHDYAQMYAFIRNIPLPEHLQAVQLISEITFVSDKTPAEAILRKGMSVSDGAEKLLEAVNSDIPSVREGAAKTLKKLCQAEDMSQHAKLNRVFRKVTKSTNSRISRIAAACLEILQGS